MKLALITIFFFTGQLLFSQSADFLLFKKHNRTIASFYTGNNIAFTNQDGNYIEAKITDIKHDTLFLRQFIVQQVPTNFGAYTLDTVGSYRYQYHYNQIKAIGRTGRKFNTSASGGALLGGGLVLTIASGVVYVADRAKFSPQLLIASVGLAGIGYLMTRFGGKGMVIGKKYSFLYVNVVPNKKP